MKNKHQDGSNIEISNALEERAKQNSITCLSAHLLAEKLGVEILEIGKEADLLGIKIYRCQLGLFGCGKNKKIVKPADTVSEHLENTIRSFLVDDRLPCIHAWEISKKLSVTKLEVSSACEALDIKIKQCQLGAF